MESSDVIVVGAGLVGLALARELHRNHFRVQLLEAGEAGQGAAWAGAGMLSGSQCSNPAMRPLAVAAGRLYPAWVADLERETGCDCGYRVSGTLVVAEPGGGRNGLEAGWEQLTAEAAAELEPELRPGGARIWRVPADHSVDNRALAQALAAAVRARGVPLREHAPVTAIEAVEGEMRVRAGEECYAATVVVNAAGAWAGSIPAPVVAPVEPRKGQMIALRSGVGLRHVVETPGAYMVPRAGGRVLVGATLEDAGFDPGVSDEHTRGLHQRAARWVPALAEATVEDAWVGFRPWTPDELPLIGPTRCAGYWLATGHFRDGILLAPITAKILARALRTGQLTRALELDPFLPRRLERGAGR